MELVIETAAEKGTPIASYSISWSNGANWNIQRPYTAT